MSELLDVLGQAGFVGGPLAVALVLLWGALGGCAWSPRGPGRPTADALLNGRARAVVGEAVAALRARRGADPAVLAAALAPFRAELGAGRTLVRSLTAVAPLLGLLGTVTGMIETFDSLGDMVLFTRGGGIGAGIGEAMVSTQVGLVVAVPGLLLGVLLERREHALLDGLEAVAARLASGEAA